MTLFGGLGMALGAWMDFPNGGPSMCGVYQRHSLFNWSNGLMLLFCFFGCRIAFRHCGSLGIVRLRIDAISMISMIAGMALGDILIALMFGSTASDPTATHWAMLLGMFLGTVGGVLVCCILSPCLPLARVQEAAGVPDGTYRNNVSFVVANDSN